MSYLPPRPGSCRRIAVTTTLLFVSSTLISSALIRSNRIAKPGREDETSNASAFNLKSGSESGFASSHRRQVVSSGRQAAFARSFEHVGAYVSPCHAEASTEPTTRRARKLRRNGTPSGTSSHVRFVLPRTFFFREMMCSVRGPDPSMKRAHAGRRFEIWSGRADGALMR